MEYWGLDLSKENFKFSAAHFLIFPDGSAERLHGHNYRVFVEIDGGLDEHGLVLDFKRVKPVVRELCDSLDEHFIAPGEHPELVVGDSVDGHREVRYRESRYLMPEGDLIVLPVNNTSSENLATWLGRRLLEELKGRFPLVEVQRLKVSVQETSGQRGVYRYHAS
ncbi:MAG: 6-carboxytetrahydropterin synthase [Planctomycetota bacterium]|nr:6-carboxytetrahydropterin synthase [Planctomycetota bacterium]